MTHSEKTLRELLRSRFPDADIAPKRGSASIQVNHSAASWTKSEHAAQEFLIYCMSRLPHAYLFGEPSGVAVPGWAAITAESVASMPLREGGWCMLLRMTGGSTEIPRSGFMPDGLDLENWRLQLAGDFLLSSFWDNQVWEIAAGESAIQLLSRGAGLEK